MKPILFLILLAAPLRAGLLATFHTTRGDVVVALQYDKTPQTVANFIGLAQGTRSWFDGKTGAVVRKPFYIGETFYRVENTASFKIAQTGSGNGTTGGGGPGYMFRDEFDPSLRHVPYVLSMANGGPNTNGSQIFLTGNATASHLDDVHTVFGLITDAPSRATIDAIMAAGNNGTTITGISFARTDPAAVAFNDNAQALPQCSSVIGNLSVKPGVKISYILANSMSANSHFRIFRSQDLLSWSNLGELYEEFGQEAGYEIIFGNANLAREFYNISLTTFPNALRQRSLASRTLVVSFNSGFSITFQFDETGNGGSFVVSSNPGVTAQILMVQHDVQPYGATLVVYSNAYNPILMICGYDSETSTNILGRHSSSQRIGLSSSPLGSGTLTLSK